MSTDSENSPASEAETTTPKDSAEVPKETYGYDFYPERFGRKTKSLLEKILTGREGGRNLACVSNVHWCLKNSKYRLTTIYFYYNLLRFIFQKKIRY